MGATQIETRRRVVRRGSLRYRPASARRWTTGGHAPRRQYHRSMLAVPCATGEGPGSRCRGGRCRCLQAEAGALRRDGRQLAHAATGDDPQAAAGHAAHQGNQEARR